MPQDAIPRPVDVTGSPRPLTVADVDPRVGTGAPGYTDRGRWREWGFGSICVGPALPHGSVQPGPDCRFGRTGGYAPGYPVSGFSQLHASGTGGGGTYGDFLLSPQTGRLYIDPDAHDSVIADECAEAHRYAATLSRFDVRVELAPTRHCVLYRLHWPDSDAAHLLLDLAHTVARDVTHRLETSIEDGGAWRCPDGVVEGWARLHNGWGGGSHTAYLAMETSVEPTRWASWRDQDLAMDSDAVAVERPHQRLGLVQTFRTRRDQPVLVRIGISLHSCQRAREHLRAELPDWDMDRVVAAGRQAWDRQLGRVRLIGSDSQRRIVASALRNSLLMPRDRTGDHPHWGRSLPFWDDQYCVWDTFRTLFPLLRLIDRESFVGNIRGFIARREQGGPVMDAFIGGVELTHQPSRDPAVPVWYGGMGGDMVDAVIAQAHATDCPDIDWPAAFAVVRWHAEHGRCDPYRRDDRGWIPLDDRCNDDGSVIRSPSSFSIEMSFTDRCAADVADRVGAHAEAARWRERAARWEALWHAELEVEGFRGFLSARRSDGSWDDAAAIADNQAFAEGTIWHYSHFVPHDLARVIALHGGPEVYCRRLEHLLEREHVFIDNEPQLLLLHTFHYAGRPDRCSFHLRKHLCEEYSLDYYPGPDDSGALASWGLFAMWGFFPNAGQDLYLLHGPALPLVELDIGGARPLRIEAPAASESAIYVQQAWLDGRPLERAWIRHAEIADGAVLHFAMGSEPSDWGRNPLPPSLSDDEEPVR